TYPGTTDEVVRPKLEANGMVVGQDFHLAFSPERIDPGNEKFGAKNTPKVVGGQTPACPRRPQRSTGASSTRSSGPRAPARRRRPSCWRTPTGTSTSRW